MIEELGLYGHYGVVMSLIMWLVALKTVINNVVMSFIVIFTLIYCYL